MGVHLALPVPPHLAAEGFVVNWIDSKGTVCRNIEKNALFLH
jgi:hypothetical protein